VPRSDPGGGGLVNRSVALAFADNFVSPCHTADEREMADIAGLVGYALGDDGMLLRGELLDTCTAEEARAAALASADYWAERDAAEEAESEVEV
jgi:hypothetical protein